MIVRRFLTTSFFAPVCGANIFGRVFELGLRTLGLVGEAARSTTEAVEGKLYMFSTVAGRVGSDCSRYDALPLANGLSLRRLPSEVESNDRCFSADENRCESVCCFEADVVSTTGDSLRLKRLEDLPSVMAIYEMKRDQTVREKQAVVEEGYFGCGHGQ